MKLQLHRVAKLFPDMTTQQFEELVEDIKKHGQLEPILLCSGKIADGRHRYKACNKLKIEPKVIRWEDIRPDKDASLVTYVISRNLRRRHLNKDQRTAIANDALPLFEMENKAKQERAAVKAGKASGEARRRQKKAKDTNVPADLRERSHSEPPETTEVSESPPTKKSKMDPKEKAAARKRESTSRAAEQAGVSPRDVQRAKALGKRSKVLLQMVKAGTIKLVLAEKIAKLEDAQIKRVLREGKKKGYQQALDDLLAPKTNQPSQRELVTKLKRATKQAEALNKTLTEAVQMAKKLKIEKGDGLIHLIELTETANTLVTQIARE